MWGSSSHTKVPRSSPPPSSSVSLIVVRDSSKALSPATLLFKFRESSRRCSRRRRWKANMRNQKGPGRSRGLTRITSLSLLIKSYCPIHHYCSHSALFLFNSALLLLLAPSHCSQHVPHQRSVTLFLACSSSKFRHTVKEERWEALTYHRYIK